MAFLLIGIVGILFLITVSGVYILLIGFLRKTDASWLIESEIRKTPFGKYFPLIVSADQWLLTHKAKGVSIKSGDGLRLHGLWVPADEAIGTIVLVHGYRSTYLVDFGPAFDYYHKMGLNLLIPDQRAHGESEGKWITFGVKESDDIQRWCRYHNEHLGNCPIILCGLSMGASTVIYTADKDLPSNIRGIIADCGFTSPNEILSAVFRRTTHLPAASALFVTNLLTRVFAGFSIYEFDSRKILKNATIPILLIHGMADNFVPYEMTEQAYAVCGSSKDILLVEGAGHGESFLVDQGRYISKVESFLNYTLGIKPRKE